MRIPAGQHIGAHVDDKADGEEQHTAAADGATNA